MALPTAETKQATGSSDGKERSNLRNRISNRLQRLNELLVRFVTTGTLRRDLAARPLPLLPWCRTSNVIRSSKLSALTRRPP
jgi:hypothetical protein